MPIKCCRIPDCPERYIELVGEAKIVAAVGDENIELGGFGQSRLFGIACSLSHWTL